MGCFSHEMQKRSTQLLIFIMPLACPVTLSNSLSYSSVFMTSAHRFSLVLSTYSPTFIVGLHTRTLFVDEVTKILNQISPAALIVRLKTEITLLFTMSVETSVKIIKEKVHSMSMVEG